MANARRNQIARSVATSAVMAGRDAAEPRRAEPSPPSQLGAALGVLCGRTRERLLVRHPGLGIISAATTLPLETDQLSAAIERSDRVLLLACDGEWIVCGLLRELPALVRDARGRQADQELVLKSNERIVLRCGEASLTLTRDGRVLVRGKNVLSRASNRNQISGATVRLN